jgi:hypothetical protein
MGVCLAPGAIMPQVGHGCADSKKTDIREDLFVESRQSLPPVRRNLPQSATEEILKARRAMQPQIVATDY